MSMSGHTPGPWWAKTDTPGAARIETERGTTIASAWSFSRNWDHGPPMHVVNAHLIAASPDLLELAKAWGAWEAKLILEARANALEFISTELYDEMLALQTQRNEAIAKAEGRE